MVYSLLPTIRGTGLEYSTGQVIKSSRVYKIYIGIGHFQSWHTPCIHMQISCQNRGLGTPKFYLDTYTRNILSLIFRFCKKQLPNFKNLGTIFRYHTGPFFILGTIFHRSPTTGVPFHSTTASVWYQSQR